MSDKTNAITPESGSISVEPDVAAAPVVSSKTIEKAAALSGVDGATLVALRRRHHWPQGRRVTQKALAKAVHDWLNGPLAASGLKPQE